MEPEVRELLDRATSAQDPKLDPAQQMRLAQRREVFVSSYLAANPGVAWEVQDVLAEDDSLRPHLARNPNVSPKLQEQFVSNDFLGAVLAGNPSLLPCLQEPLWENGTMTARRALAANPGLVDTLREEILETPGALHYLAANPNLSVDHQTKVLEQGKQRTLRVLAANPALDLGLHVELASKGNFSVFVQLAERSDFVWSAELPAKFVRKCKPSFYDDLVGDRSEAADALLLSWDGSLKDLLQACELVER